MSWVTARTAAIAGQQVINQDYQQVSTGHGLNESGVLGLR